MWILLLCVYFLDLWKIYTHETSSVVISSQRGALCLGLCSLRGKRSELLCHGELGLWLHFPPCATVRNASVQQSSEFPLVIATKSIAEMISRWFFPSSFLFVCSLPKRSINHYFCCHLVSKGQSKDVWKTDWPLDSTWHLAH